MLIEDIVQRLLQKVGLPFLHVHFCHWKVEPTYWSGPWGRTPQRTALQTSALPAKPGLKIIVGFAGHVNWPQLIFARSSPVSERSKY